MLQRTLQRLTFKRHAKESSPRCEVRETLTGGYCEKPGTQRTMEGLLCEQHARLFGLEERIACWEAILLHIANLAIKCATYRWSNDGRKSRLYQTPVSSQTA